MGLTLTLVWGCTEKINIDLNESDIMLVVEGSITNVYKPHLITLTKSSSYFISEIPEPVTGATVTIQDSRNIYNLREAEPGVYHTQNIRGYPGKTYILTIKINGQIYTASSKMPQTPVIDSIKFYLDENDPQLFYIGLFAQENPEPGDHYFWSVYKEMRLISDNVTKLVIANDDLINGSYLNGMRVQSLKAREGNRITLEMASITEEYYKYCLGIIRETVYADSPFETAPANIKGNISNNAIGFFTAYSVTHITRVLTIKE